MNDLTIVVQGPFNVTSLANLMTYAKFGPVIVAGWQNVPADLLNSVIDACRASRAELLLLQPPAADSLMNPQNIYYQALSTWKALQRVSTRFVVKFRSDESYTELGPMLERLHKEPARIWGSSVYFRKDAQHKYHIGDHIIAGDRRILTRGFRHTLTTCESMIPLPGQQILPEQLITRSCLLALGEQPLFKQSKDLMRKHFGPLSLQLFGKLSCKLHAPRRGGMSRKYIHNDDRAAIDSTGRCIHDSIEEL